jgi:predicted lipid-binding transport protein (Tim44 family)
LSNQGARGWLGYMIKRSDIVYLGLASGVIGSLVGGMLLGVGMSLIIGGAPIGWLLLLPAAPAGGVPGWVLANRLARNLP